MRSNLLRRVATLGAPTSACAVLLSLGGPCGTFSGVELPPVDAGAAHDSDCGIVIDFQGGPGCQAALDSCGCGAEQRCAADDACAAWINCANMNCSPPRLISTSTPSTCVKNQCGSLPPEPGAEYITLMAGCFEFTTEAAASCRW